MKIKMFFRFTAAFFTILVLLADSSVAYAKLTYAPSSWSSSQIAISETIGIIPEGFNAQPYTKSITRNDFCELLINTCRIFGITLPAPPKSHPFTDTKDINAEYAYSLGFTKGTEVGTFSPDQPLTREMAAVMLSKMLMLFQSTSGNYHQNTDSNNYTASYTQPFNEEQAAKILAEYSTDGHLVSDWAKIYMADVYTHGILLGTGRGRLDPKSDITREQAVILSLNVLTYCDESQIQAAGVKECVLPMPTGIFISQS